MHDLVIREAVVEDMAALCLLRNARMQHEAKFVEMSAGTAHFLVALTDDTLVAFATVYLRNPVQSPPKSHIPKLSDCFVAPGHRSRGIGRALVSARERIAHAAGCAQLYVSIDPVENPRWMQFFRRRGYRELQAKPYRKRELRISREGLSEELLGWRQDLVVDLHGLES